MSQTESFTAMMMFIRVIEKLLVLEEESLEAFLSIFQLEHFLELIRTLMRT